MYENEYFKFEAEGKIPSLFLNLLTLLSMCATMYRNHII